MSKTCQHCTHSKEVALPAHPKDVHTLECRRYAPRMLHGAGEGWSDRKWPYVDYPDWCGEFHRKGD